MISRIFEFSILVLVKLARDNATSAQEAAITKKTQNSRGIKGVKAGGSAPVSKEYGKIQPLRALCFPSLALSTKPTRFTDRTTGATARSLEGPVRFPLPMPVEPVPLLSLGHGTSVAWSWRPHARHRRRFRLRSPGRIFRFRVVLCSVSKCLRHWPVRGCPRWRRRWCRRR